jgi:hypothetical protein
MVASSGGNITKFNLYNKKKKKRKEKTAGLHRYKSIYVFFNLKLREKATSQQLLNGHQPATSNSQKKKIPNIG